MTSEHLEDDVGTGLKCHTFGSLALTVQVKCKANAEPSSLEICQSSTLMQ